MPRCVASLLPKRTPMPQTPQPKAYFHLHTLVPRTCTPQAYSPIRIQNVLSQGTTDTHQQEEARAPAGHLSAGVQAHEARLAQQPGLHAAAQVVLGGHHGDGVLLQGRETDNGG